jgi:hypothetical protein
MSQQIISIPLSSTTTTLYRNWVNAISAALTTLGLTKTSDTGQVVLTGSTLAFPTTAQGLTAGYSTYNAYEIRQLVSSGKPTLYLKLRYGVYYDVNGTGAAYYWPTMTVEIGSATDGAGNITPIDAGGVRYITTSSGAMAGSSSLNSGKPSPTAQQCILASDGQNYFTLIMGNQAPSYESSWIAAMGFERTNTPGATTFTFDSNGVVMWSLMTPASENTISGVAGAVYSGATGTYYVLHDLVNQASYTSPSIPGQTPGYVYKPNGTTNATMYPVTVGVGHGPLITLFAYDIGQLTENSQFTFAPFGVSSTYLASGRVNIVGDPYSLTKSAIRIT